LPIREVVLQNPELAQRFAEIHPPFDSHSALAEANRCLYCFDAPCTGACPTHIDVPRFIKKIAQQNLSGSALTILDANILGASCSRVCPVELLCEGACVYRAYKDRPIQIARLQRYAMDHFFGGGAALRYEPASDRRERIACIGAGPASLACAAELRRRGFHVTVFERRPLPGGLNTYGVAEYKLRSADSLREIEMIRALGIEFRFGDEISGESGVASLEKEFAAIFLGIGLGAMFKINIPGEDLPGVVNALAFIEAYKTKGGLAVGRKVVVVGGGNTAIDAARAAIRLGADEVHLVYRRGLQHMSAFAFEFEQARQEGVRFRWFTQPVRIRASAAPSQIESIECVRVQLSPQGTLEPVGDSRFAIPCDMVIPAIGQSPLLEFLRTCRGICIEERRVQVNRATGQTSNPKYFAGGDCVNGGREVVDAVADGKRAALGIAQALEAAHARSSDRS
jgi:dihydropyrimidine dehydrogenase (NAD+) subunit PreT